MSEIFRIYVSDPGLMTRAELKGMWEATVIEQGGRPATYPCVTVRRFGNRVTVAGKADRA